MADRYLLESGAPDGYLLEDGTGVLLLEVPATPVDDGEGWWSGAAMSFAAVAIAGAAALLSTNVAVARTFVQQDEIPAAAATPASATSSIIPTQRARVSPAFQQWYAPDELPTQAVTPSVDEVYDWTPLVPTSSIRAFGVSPEWDDQALSWSLDDQYSWNPGWVVSTVVPRLDAAGHQDEVPTPPAVFTPEEDTEAPTQAAVPRPVSMGMSPSWADEGLSWYIDEQYEWIPRWVAPQVSSLPFFDSDALPTALDEETWSAPVVALQKTVTLLAFEDEAYSPSATPPISEEDPWPLFGIAVVVNPTVTVWNVADECVTVPAFIPQDDDAATTTVIVSNPNVVIWATDDEIVPQESAPSIGGGVLRERVNVVRWYQGDDLPVAIATTPQFEDDAWRVFTPAPQAPNRSVWAEDDHIIPTPTFGLEEFDSPLLVPALVKAKATLWFSDDERIQFVAPTLAFEDDAWNGFTPPHQTPNVAVWAEDEQIVPQPTFSIEEFESPLFVPALVKANAPLWFGDDERIAFVAPTPTFEDDSWNILRSVSVDRAPYFAMMFQGSTDDGSIIVIEPPPPPTGTHTWLLVKRRTRR